jgi:hypothetical protein
VNAGPSPGVSHGAKGTYQTKYFHSRVGAAHVTYDIEDGQNSREPTPVVQNKSFCLFLSTKALGKKRICSIGRSRLDDGMTLTGAGYNSTCRSGAVRMDSNPQRHKPITWQNALALPPKSRWSDCVVPRQRTVPWIIYVHCPQICRGFPTKNDFLTRTVRGRLACIRQRF